MTREARETIDDASTGVSKAEALEGLRYRVATPEEVDAYLRKAREMRAEAVRETFGALFRALGGAPAEKETEKKPAARTPALKTGRGAVA